MGLLPLEFSDCLLDSPYYRENLKAHEKQLEQTSLSIKSLISGITGVLESAKLLSKAKKTLADALENCQFDCLGTTLTDDEILIASSLKQFAKFLSSMEDELNSILLQANEKFITPLLNFRKDQIGSVKNTKKAFEKATSKLCTAQERFVSMSGKKEESLAEASEILRHEQKNLNSCSLEYVYLMHMVQERKKFEFVEAILNFNQSWVNYYRKGSNIAREQEEYMTDLENRVKKTRDNFSATSDKYESLKEKLSSSSQDPGLINKMYTRQGYLFVQGKKNLKLGSVWTKYFCQYQTKTKILTMIPYSQLTGKISGGESIRVTGCTCHEDTWDKFRFSVSGEDLTEAGQGMVTHTVQALSEYDRKHWVEALGGTWPAVNTLQRIRADSVEDNLNSCAFTFLKDCLCELESRGLMDQGLYRVGGVVSKVKKLLNQALDPAPGDECPDMSDPKQWESKTLASAVKQYFRDLSKPLMTYQLYNNFLEAVKKEEESTRLNEIYLVLQKLPRANREILKVLIRHLNKVSQKSEKNLMTASNLGVVFGPSLLRPREETVATIMDIKFCNVVISILIENCERFFSSAESSPEFLHQKNRRPSLESRSTTGSVPLDSRSTAGSNCSTAGVSEAASPAVSVKLKRNQSFSSFSQLSAASLPDIKEFHQDSTGDKRLVRDFIGTLTSPTLSRLASSENRPRSKSHQHDFLPPNFFPTSTTSITASSSKESSPSPAPLHLSRAATQDDLMASLEMMNLLASDLPSNSPLKRSYTLNPKRISRTPGREVTRKPPLPKLPSVPSTPIRDTPISFESITNNNSGLYLNFSNQPPTSPNPPPFHRQNSAPVPSPSFEASTNEKAAFEAAPTNQRTAFSHVIAHAQDASKSNTDSALKAPASNVTALNTSASNTSSKTKAARPSDLPNKLISAFEGLCSSPGQNRRQNHNNNNNNLMIEEYGCKKDQIASEGLSEGFSAPGTKTEQTFVNTTIYGKSINENHTKPRYTNFINVTVSAETKAHVPVSSPVPVSESAHNKNGKNCHSNGHDGQTNVSMDSGVLLSPSPPTDSGIVLMSPHVASKFNNNNTNSKLLASNQQSLDQHEDSVSVLSCSLSEGSEASSSRYDNVVSDVPNRNIDTVDSSDIHDEFSDTDTRLVNPDENKALNTCDFDEIDCELETGFETKKPGPKSERKLELINSKHRDSGPYENVINDNNEVGIDTGLSNLRKILTNGQSTNV